MERATEVRAACDVLGVAVDERAVRLLLAYADLLDERAVPLGMISRADGDRLLERHVLDSLRPAPLIRDARPATLVDLGSGAGLPGVPLSIVLGGTQFTLAESRSKRAAFLELVVERLELSNARVHADRVQALPPGSFEMATARAFAQPARAWEIAGPLLKPGGRLVLFAGARERVTTDLLGASDVRHWSVDGHLPPHPALVEGSAASGSSGANALASVGGLVIITAK